MEEVDVTTHAFKLFGIMRLRNDYQKGKLADAIQFSNSLIVVSNRFGFIVIADPRGAYFVCFMCFVSGFRLFNVSDRFFLFVVRS